MEYEKSQYLGIETNNDKSQNHEREKDFEKALDATIEQFLSRGKNVDSGRQALIFKFSFEDIAPDLLSFLEKKGLRPENALKLLKIYQPGKANKEYGMQRKAYDLVNSIPESEKANYAKIPFASVVHSMKISDETKIQLNSQGAGLKDNNVELLIMDWIPGDDLAKLMYKTILKHTNEYQDSYEGNFSEMEAVVFEKLGISRLSDVGEIQTEKEQEELAVKLNIEKNKKIISSLKRKDFSVSPSLSNKLSNTLNLLESDNIYHNDVLERNVMINGDEIYLIDFGWADEVSNGTDSYSVVRLLKELGTSNQEEISKENQERLKSLESLRRILLKNEKWLLNYKKIKSDFANKPETLLILLGNSLDKVDIQKNIILMQDFIIDNVATKSEILNIINKRLELINDEQSKLKGKISRSAWSKNELQFYKKLFE